MPVRLVYALFPYARLLLYLRHSCKLCQVPAKHSMWPCRWDSVGFAM